MAMAQPKYAETPARIRNPRSARTATQTRIVKNNRARYGGLLRVSAAIGSVLVALLAYVMLISNVTSLSYAVAKAQQQRTALQEETARLDDRLSTLESDDRLARVAAKLGMKDPQSFAVVQLEPPSRVASSHFPVFDSIALWLNGNAATGRAR